MKIVIDIPEEKYQGILNMAEEILDASTFCYPRYLYMAVLNGTPLPKGHGRLLDEKEILASEDHEGGWYDLVDMPEYIAGVPAVIEADKESEEQA